MNTHRRRTPRAFTLPELLAAAAVVGVTIALLGLMGGRSRKLGQCGESMANLKQIGALTGSYAADYQERVWALTWRSDRVPMDADPDLAMAAMRGPDLVSASAQTIQIFRRRLQRPSLEPLSNWIPHVSYSTIVLAEYAALDLPSPLFISPGDHCRLAWARDPLGPFEGRPMACNEGGRGGWASPFSPFSASYEISPSFYSPDSGPDAITQGGTHFLYSPPTSQNVLGDRMVNEIAHPSQKAMVWETADRFYAARPLFSLVIGARFPVLFGDGSVCVRAREAWRWPNGNPGWNPRLPSSVFPMTLSYEPARWEPPTPNGMPTFSVTGFHRWTRWGLRGRDFDGPEVTQP